MNCGYCNLELLDTQPKCTLLCNHTVHTRCFYTINMQYNIENIICNECNVLLIPDELRIEVFGEPTATCENLAQNSPSFVNSINNLIKTIKNNNKTKALLTKKVTPINTEFKNFSKQIIKILKDRINIDIKKIKGLPEYKEAIKNSGVITRLFSKICDDYNINRYDIHSYIRTITGIRTYSFGRRHNNIAWYIKRKFFIRIN